MIGPVSPRKKMAMSEPKYAKGGRIGGNPLKTGVPLNPITQSKRMNGIPGFKKGGKC